MERIVKLSCILAILIFIDLVATLFWVHAGWAVEANPVMDFFLKFSPLLFVLGKLGLSFTGIYILYVLRTRFRKTILNILLGLNLIYATVCLYHLLAMLFLLT
jgi:hypothetical protein